MLIFVLHIIFYGHAQIFILNKKKKGSRDRFVNFLEGIDYIEGGGGGMFAFIIFHKR